MYKVLNWKFTKLFNERIIWLGNTCVEDKVSFLEIVDDDASLESRKTWKSMEATPYSNAIFKIIVLENDLKRKRNWHQS